MSTRICFGPQKGWTTSIHNYFLNNQTDRFYVNPNRHPESGDDYFEGYDHLKVFIEDRPFMYRVRNGEIVPTDLHFPVDHFDNDYLILNIRPFEKQVRSFFLTAYFMEFVYEPDRKALVEYERPLDMEKIFLWCVKSYSANILKEGPVDNGFKGIVYFVQEQNFEINNILDLCQIEHDPVTLGFHHTEIQKLRYSRSGYMEANKEWLKYFNKHRDMFEQARQENIDIYKNTEFQLGDFDEQLYRYTYIK